MHPVGPYYSPKVWLLNMKENCLLLVNEYVSVDRQSHKSFSSTTCTAQVIYWIAVMIHASS